MDKLLLILIVPLHYFSIYWINSKLKHSKGKKEIVKKSTFLLFKDCVYTPLLIVVVLGFIFWDKNIFLQKFLVQVGVLIQMIGLIMYVFGFSLKFWAYHCLGKNWSSKITIYQNHQLVNFGPYSIVRHPVYVGYMMTFIGLSIYCGNLLLLALSIIYTTMNFTRAKQEEILLLQKFGLLYKNYMRRVDAFAPRIVNNIFAAILLILGIGGAIIGGIDETYYLLTGNSFTMKIVCDLITPMLQLFS